MNVPHVDIIDYGIGNLKSIASAIDYLGASVNLVSDTAKISESSALILPGVGSFNKAMDNINRASIDKAILYALDNNAKILGICLGMQLMGSVGTEDGEKIGLGLMSNRVDRFDKQKLLDLKIPHVGFNQVKISEKKGLFEGFKEKPDFYFTHSYRMLTENVDGRFATCNYGENFLAAFEVGNICGAQFHPEKSQTNGLLFLRNFLIK